MTSKINKTNVMSRFHWLRSFPIIPVLFLAPLVVCGIFGPLLYPHDPHAINLSMALKPPGWLPGGNMSYFLGTDQMGRDLLSKLIEGARASLIVSIFGVIFSGLVGVSLGIIAGYYGGVADNIVMRIVDAWMAIPIIFFILMLTALMRQLQITGLVSIVIAITITMWVPYTRVVRAEALSLKQRDFVALARTTGCSSNRIMIKHIWPNVTNSMIVMATTQLGAAIMAEAGMSFLGVGVQPPSTAWGLLISESITYMSSAWWIPTFAGLAITITILGSNMLGDWLRDFLDPITRQSMK